MRTPALRLERLVEMYQWREHRVTYKEDDEERVRYEYDEVWADRRIRSEDFKHPIDHANPPWPPGLATFGANAAAPVLMGYRLPARLVAQLPRARVWVKPEDLVRVDPLQAAGLRVQDAGFYRGPPGPGPRIGDLRIRFQRIEAQPVTVLAARRGDGLVAARSPSGREVWRLAPGTVALPVLAEAEAAEARPNMVLAWVLALLLVLPGLALVGHAVHRHWS